MSTSLHSVVHRRLAVPAWLVAVAVAAPIAIGAGALLHDSDRPDAATAAPARSAAAPTPPLQADTTCVNSRIVGHC